MPSDHDEDGWYPLHHAIQDTLDQAGLLDVVLELARGMPVEAFDRLANSSVPEISQCLVSLPVTESRVPAVNIIVV
jgi:hypothetical protein